MTAPADDLVARLRVTENKCIEAYSDSPSGDIDTALLAAIDDLREAADALASRDQRIAALTADLVATQRDYQEARDAHDDKMQLWQAAERRAEAAIPRFWLQGNCYPSELQTVYRLLEAYDAAIAAQNAKP